MPAMSAELQSTNAQDLQIGVHSLSPTEEQAKLQRCLMLDSIGMSLSPMRHNEPRYEALKLAHADCNMLMQGTKLCAATARTAQVARGGYLLQNGLDPRCADCHISMQG